LSSPASPPTSASPASAAFLQGVPSALQSLRRVHVGSANAPKIQAVRDALACFLPGIEGAGVEINGVDVVSGVPEQPVGFDEILRGAKNRAEAALTSGGQGCDLAFGIEDGLVTLPGVEAIAGPNATLNIGCAWLTDGRRESFGLSSAFGYPDDCVVRAVRDREPIGELFDALWRAREPDAGASGPSGRGIGNIGKLSLGVLPRAEYGRHAVVCALVRYLHPDLYAGQYVAEAERTDAGVGA